MFDHYLHYFTDVALSILQELVTLEGDEATNNSKSLILTPTYEVGNQWLKCFSKFDIDLCYLDAQKETVSTLCGFVMCCFASVPVTDCVACISVVHRLASASVSIENYVASVYVADCLASVSFVDCLASSLFHLYC